MKSENERPSDTIRLIMMLVHLLPPEAQQRLMIEAEQLSREEAAKQAPAGLDPDIWGDVISDLGGA